LEVHDATPVKVKIEKADPRLPSNRGDASRRVLVSGDPQAASSDSDMDTAPDVALKRKASAAGTSTAAKRARTVTFDGVEIRKAEKVKKGRSRLQKAQKAYLDRIGDLAEHDRRIAAAYHMRAEILAKVQVAAKAFGEASDFDL
jgi:hypothetical protein